MIYCFPSGIETLLIILLRDTQPRFQKQETWNEEQEKSVYCAVFPSPFGGSRVFSVALDSYCAKVFSSSLSFSPISLRKSGVTLPSALDDGHRPIS